MTVVSLVHLSKQYDQDAWAVQDLNLVIEEGELMVLLGPSGCGKTTTLRMIAGLTAATQGDIRFDGRSVLTIPAERRGAAMVFQQHALFPFMSVGDNVAFGLAARRLPRAVVRERVAQALAAVQLSGYEDRWPDQLSGGQQQRVALARVLAIQPRVLLLDEPLSNLDPALREELRAVIREVQRAAGITTLFVTHDQTEAVVMGDRLALMLDGRLQQVGEPRELFERPANVQVARFFGGVNFIPGVKQGRVVQTKLGAIQIERGDHPDGPVLLTIRPEAIELGRNGHNTLTGEVRAYDYRGAQAFCRVRVRELELQIALPPFRRLRPAQPLTLHLPPDRLHPLPGT